MGREDYNLSLIVGSVYLTVLRNCTETRDETRVIVPFKPPPHT